MASRSRVLIVSVVTLMPLSLRKYRLAPTTAAPTSRTATVMRMFFRDMMLRLRLRRERGPDRGDSQNDYEVNRVQRYGDRRRTPLVQHAEPDGQSEQPPELKHVDGSEQPREKRVVVEKGQEHAECGWTRQGLTGVVKRNGKQRLKPRDDAGVRNDGEYLLERGVSAEERVEDAQQDAGHDGHDDGDGDEIPTEHDIADKRRDVFDGLVLLVAHRPSERLGLPDLLVDPRVLPHPRLEQQKQSKRDEQR